MLLLTHIMIEEDWGEMKLNELGGQKSCQQAEHKAVF